jgi:hypothetical protein
MSKRKGRSRPRTPSALQASRPVRTAALLHAGHSAQDAADSFRSLLARLIDAPHLARVVPHLAPETLHQLIRRSGLDACGELVAAATPEQLARRDERIQATFAEIYPEASARGFDGVAQLADMDIEGVDLGFLYPSFGLFVIASDDQGAISPDAAALLPQIPISYTTSKDAGWTEGLLRPSYRRFAPRGVRGRTRMRGFRTSKWALRCRLRMAP